MLSILRTRAPVARKLVQSRLMTTVVAGSQHELPPFPARAVPGTSPWRTTEPVPFTRDSVIDLLYGKTPLIKEPGFLSPEECAKYEDYLSPLVTPYKHNTGPPLHKVGLAQFEYQAQSAEDFANRSDEQEQYFKDTAEWSNFHTKITEERGLDAWYRIFHQFASLFPDWDVQVATEGPGRQYFSGIFRALNNSTYLHCDFSPFDSLSEDWVINAVEHQIVYNLYLAPVKKGRTFVYDVEWTEEALKYRDPAHYGYHHDLVKNAKRVVCEPELGALCMFNSRNMHEVEAVTVENMPNLGMTYRPRLTLSSFMGLVPSSKTGGRPRLIFWS